MIEMIVNDDEMKREQIILTEICCYVEVILHFHSGTPSPGKSLCLRARTRPKNYGRTTLHVLARSRHWIFWESRSQLVSFTSNFESDLLTKLARAFITS